MKKILSMGIASAVLALTAIAASAEYVAASNENPVAGGSIIVEVTSTEEVDVFDFTVAAEGLEVADIAYAEGSTADKSDNADGSINVAGFSLNKIAAGTPLATITYTVTGETGSDVKVTLSKFKSDATFAAPLQLTVVDNTDPVDPPVDPGTPGDPGTEPGDPGTEPGDPGTPADPETPPETGVALAVVPAVLAGAAVVVAKKRK